MKTLNGAATTFHRFCQAASDRATVSFQGSTGGGILWAKPMVLILFGTNKFDFENSSNIIRYTSRWIENWVLGADAQKFQIDTRRIFHYVQILYLGVSSTLSAMMRRHVLRIVSGETSFQMTTIVLLRVVVQPSVYCHEEGSFPYINKSQAISWEGDRSRSAMEVSSPNEFIVGNLRWVSVSALLYNFHQWVTSGDRQMYLYFHERYLFLEMILPAISRNSTVVVYKLLGFTYAFTVHCTICSLKYFKNWEMKYIAFFNLKY